MCEYNETLELSCEHKETLELPCEHKTCEDCFFNIICDEKLFKCNECNFDNSKLQKYIELENSQACYIMGLIYVNGIGCLKNKECISLFLNSLKNNKYNIKVYIILGNIYYNGFEDIKIDYKKALEYYKKALYYYRKNIKCCKFDNNNINLYNLYDNIDKIYYSNGLVIENKYQNAIEYYDLNKEYNYIASIYYYGKYDIEKNYYKAFEYYNKTIESCNNSNCNGEMYYNISNLYSEGHGNFECNFKKSIYYLQKSIDCYKNGKHDYNEELMKIYHDVGRLYMTGDKYLIKDYKKTMECYKICIDYYSKTDKKFSPFTINVIYEYIANYYYYGPGITSTILNYGNIIDIESNHIKDYIEAYKYYELSNNLYMQGKIQFDINNYNKAIEKLKVIKNSHHDFLKSRLLLGKIYMTGGNGVVKDYAESINYYKQAYCCEKNEIARARLHEIYKKINNLEKATEYIK